MAPGNAYIYPFAAWQYGLDLWLEVDENGFEIAHWGNGDAIPGDYDIWIMYGWSSPIRGTTQNAPYMFLYDFTIMDTTGNVVWPPPAFDALSYWSTVYNAGAFPAFNKASATYWARDWFAELPSLESGDYSGSIIETVTRPVTDSSLDFIYPDYVKHEQQRPLKFWPGTTTYTFTFSVGP